MKYWRLYQILAVFRAYQLVELLPKSLLPKRFKIVLASLFWIRKKAKNSTGGERLKLALQELGPIWIKFGQMLSTRQDLLSNDLLHSLSQLQDNVAPFDGHLAQQIIEQSLSVPIESLFTDFCLTPLASASIAQIHTAKLKSSGADVIIKVIRPNIQPLILADTSLMYWFANRIENANPDAKRLRLQEVVRDYERTILNELNLLREAEYTKRLRHNFLNSDMLYIPYVYRELCRTNVMVEERISGIPINDMSALIERGVNMKLLAERGVNTFFTQVFRDNLFHADMHPGNIFIDATDPINPRYIGIDCAIMGELSKEDQHFLARNFIAFFNRDYYKIAELYIESGWVPEHTDIFSLELAMREVCDPIFEKSLGEISFAQILFNLFKVARQFDMVIQPQLVLLEKTLFYIEGLGRRLYPQLDLWSTAKPFLEAWYQEQISPIHLAKNVVHSLPQWHSLLPDLPNKIKNYELTTKQLNQQLLEINQQLQQNQIRQRRLNYIIAVIVIVALGLNYFSF